jgi:hypothetical protein
VEKAAFDYWEVAHLINVKKWNGVKSVSLLKGLFLYRRDGESSHLRIFYLPFHLGWSRTHSPNPPLAKPVRLETEGGASVQSQTYSADLTSPAQVGYPKEGSSSAVKAPTSAPDGEGGF